MIISIVECGDPYGVEAVAVAVTLSALERGERAIILAPVKVWGHSGQARGSKRSWRKKDWEAAMGIDWMSKDELAQAIPPAYTEFIGTQLMANLKANERTGAPRG